MAENKTSPADTSWSLSDFEIDVVGEVMNISVGAAATALSKMLDKQVSITAPKVAMQQFKDVSASILVPSMLVKIEYIEGIIGTNAMVLRQEDMQTIVNLMMGKDFNSTDLSRD
jgi:flagellar motor switch protein FliN/FliY